MAAANPTAPRPFIQPRQAQAVAGWSRAGPRGGVAAANPAPRPFIQPRQAQAVAGRSRDGPRAAEWLLLILLLLVPSYSLAKLRL